MKTKINSKEIINLSLFSFGKLISLFGTSIYTFAISLYVLKVTGSGISFAINLAVGLLPIIIIGPFAGVLADRFKRKNLVVLMDILNGLLFLLLFFISGKYGLSILLINISTFIMTSFTTVFGISLEAGKPNIVSEKMIMTINSISKILDSTSSILGPMIGGVIYAFIDIELFILLNGISFVISGISEMFIDFNFNPQSKRENSRIDVFNEIKEGLEYLKRKGELISILMLFIMINFFVSLSISVPIPYIINETLRLDSSYYGIIQGSFPVGMILGALVVKRISSKTSYYKMLLKLTIILSMFIIMEGLPLLVLRTRLDDIFYLIYYSLILGVFGVIVSLIDIPIMSILQSIIEDSYRGRVMSLVMSIVKITTPIAFILSGILMNNLQSWVAPIVGGVLLLAYSLSLYNKEKLEKNYSSVLS